MLDCGADIGRIINASFCMCRFFKHIRSGLTANDYFVIKENVVSTKPIQKKDETYSLKAYEKTGFRIETSKEAIVGRARL